MDEYISKTELLKVINTDIAEAHNERCVQLLNAILYATTADVVPKSEVEKLTVELDAMRGAANTYKMHYENAMKEIERLKDYNTGVAFKHYFDGRKEVAMEIFEEIESKKMFLKDCVGNMGVVVLFKDISELKKKYTEEKK